MCIQYRQKGVQAHLRHALILVDWSDDNDHKIISILQGRGKIWSLTLAGTSKSACLMVLKVKRYLMP